MSPKRKAFKSPLGGKPDKKGIIFNDTNVSVLTKDDDDEKVNIGKNENEKKNEVIGVCRITGKASSPELLDKKADIQSEIKFDTKNKGTAFWYHKNICIPVDLGGQKTNINEDECPKFASNQLLEQKSKMNLRWKAFLFPPWSVLTDFGKTTHHYFGLDLINEDRESTHWVHNACVWQNLFSDIFELATTGQAEPIYDAFDGILSCPVRAVPKGPNEIKTFKSAKNQKSEHWIMLIKIPHDMNMDDHEYIDWFLSWF